MRQLNRFFRVALASTSVRITLASILAALMTSLVAAPAATASLIVWQTPVVVDTNNPTQVLTNGIVLVAADTITPYTVNGVSFSGNLDTLVTNFTNEGSPLGPSGTDYHKMLNSSTYRQSGATATITISSLTIGKLYEVELFTPFWNADFESKFSDGANSVLMGNTASVPTLVVGTFTADTTTKLISFDAANPTGSFGLLSAIQVLAVPEPASLGLLAIGGVALLKRRRACVAVASGSVRIALASMFVAFLTSLAAAPAAKASLIVWQTPVADNTNDPTQILTNGIVLVASDLNVAYTVNGVNFSPTLATYVTNASSFTGEGYGPYNTNYAKMLAGGAYRASGGTANIAISSLTIGKLYEVQIFTPFWDANYQSQFSDGANSVLMGNTSAAPTFVVGTFTADVSTKNISFDAAPSSAYGLLSAFQVLAVPEPASLGLVAVGGLALLKRRRAC